MAEGRLVAVRDGGAERGGGRPEGLGKILRVREQPYRSLIALRTDLHASELTKLYRVSALCANLYILSPLHANLQVWNFQRCVCAFHQCEA